MQPGRSLASFLLVFVLSWCALRTLEVAQAGTPADPSIVSGTGFLVSPKGYFLTAAHVVGDVADLTVCPGISTENRACLSENILVTFISEICLAISTENPACLAAEVVARDPAHDLALLKVKNGDALRQVAPLRIGNASRVRRQDAVWVMGFPFADQTGGSLTTTSGHITAIQPGTEGHRFQLDAAVNPGNSGGPLLNDRGEVIGVITSKLLVREAGFTVSEGLNYAVPISFALSLLANIPDFDFSALGQAKQRLSPQDIDQVVAPGVVRILVRQEEWVVIGITGKDGTPMMLVPAGEFLYGDDKQRISLPAFYMDKFEVSTAQYAKYMAATGAKEPRYWPTSVLVSHGQKPVVGVFWYEADAYCRAYGKRLPTEKEWEKAARGTDGREYPWGNEEPNRSLASYDWDGKRSWQGYATLASVESYEAGKSPYGLYHMAGNVWEWTSSDYDNSGKFKVVRGGGWVSSAFYLRSSNRRTRNPADWYSYVGFRCAQDAR